MSGTFDSGFNLAGWGFFLNHQTKITTNTNFERTLWEYLISIPGQSAKLNIQCFCLPLNICQIYNSNGET